MTSRLTVIIPTLNEARALPRTLQNVRETCPDSEILVADGGSIDQTVMRAYDGGARVVVSPPGRSIQMNAGAARASGDLLLFLHADTLLPPDAGQLVERALTQSGAAAGSFYLTFDDPHPLLRLYSEFSRLNWSWFTFGDQGIFVGRRTFERLDGFRPIPIMEDLDFQSRLRQTGCFTKLNAPVTTSARRFRRLGIARQQLLNVALVLSFKCGVKPESLARYYRQHFQ